MSSGQLMHRLRYFVSDAWDEWRHSPGVNLLAVATLAATLFVDGLVSLVVTNLSRHLEDQRRDIQVHVYLLDGIEEAERERLAAELRRHEGVAAVEYVDREEALARYQRWAGQRIELLEGLEENPLPASLEVALASGPEAEARGDEIAASLAGRAGIEEVRFDRAWLQRLESILAVARVGGLVLAALVFAAVVFVMASVLRLAVYARRNEIDIMLLVGATPAFVRGPFLVAGLGQGLLAGGLSLLFVEAARRTALAYAGSGSVALLELILVRPLSPGLSLFLVAIGIFVSLAGAFFAVRGGV